MFTIEVFVPPGTLTPERRVQLAERLGSTLVPPNEVSSATVSATLAATDVLIHEPTIWSLGGRVISPDREPRYIVRVTVPGAWRKELSEHLAARITAALAAMDDRPGRLYREPDVLVQIMGVPEGGYGIFGRIQRAGDLAALLASYANR